MDFLKYTVRANRLKYKERGDFVAHMKNLLYYFKEPQNEIKNIIHVAGTNGKGSSCNFIANILKKSGYSFNLFTSPHLVKVNERFSLNGDMASDEQLQKIDKEIEEKIKENNLDISYFEGCVIASLLLFKENEADFNIFEVGLGGIYDATNIFEKKLVSVITSISLDHTKILGESLEEIALNKVGIVQENGVLLTSKQKSNVLAIFDYFCQGVNAKLFSEGVDWNYKIRNEESFDYSDFSNYIENIKPSLKGKHQFENSSLAIATCLYLKSLNFKKIDQTSIKKGISSTVWHGRIEEIELDEYRYLTIITDGAHNEDGVLKLNEYLKKTKNNYNQTVGVFIMIESKDIDVCFNMIKDFNNFDKIYIPDIKTNLDENEKGFRAASELEVVAKKYNLNNVSILKDFDKNKVEDLFKKYNERLSKNRIIFFGSLYFIGKINEYYDIQ